MLAVNCAFGAEIEVRFHPGVDIDPAKDHVVLRAASPEAAGRGGRQGAAARGAAARPTPQPADGEHRYTTGDAPTTGTRARRSDLEMLTLFHGAFSVIQGRQPDLPITEEPQLTWAPYFSTVVTAPAEENIIASVFFPTGSSEAATTGAPFQLESENGAPVVVGTLGGKSFKYVFGPDQITRTVN